MYNPSAFRETRLEILEQTMAAHPLATLVTLASHGLEASHIPLLHCRVDGGPGILRGHIARMNSQWQSRSPETEALAVFSGPQHYVSPRWYASKKEHGQVVPTWNYIVVHARGKLAFQSDPEWLLANVQALTDAQEKDEPRWRVSDAPREYIESMLGAIVGVEMTITKLEGKWKLSQNRSLADREGVIAGLETLDSRDAHEVARLMHASLPK